LINEQTLRQTGNERKKQTLRVHVQFAVSGQILRDDSRRRLAESDLSQRRQLFQRFLQQRRFVGVVSFFGLIVLRQNQTATISLVYM
jgi:hypothetical protein